MKKSLDSFLNKIKNLTLTQIEIQLQGYFAIISEHGRSWIYKPRYSYAGQGIHVFSSNAELESVFKVKSVLGNRAQYQAKYPGYLMQE